MQKENNKTSQSRDFIQSLEKGLKVIEAFTEDQPFLSVTEAAALTGYSRPAVRRILITLKELGYAEEKRGRYALTAKVLSLGFSYISSQNIWNIAAPHLEKFVNETQESSSISVLDGGEVVYVARVPTKRIMTISLNVGSRLPAYATSMGKLLLAYLPETEKEAYLATLEAQRLTSQTKADPDVLRQELHEIAKKGWAFADQELEEGLRSIAVPIFDHEDNVCAAVNSSAHAGRVSAAYMEERFLPLLQETAQAISRDLAAYQRSFSI
ncbi:IclR family transcriptional regulator domain-containing protein [Bacillus piscicola]|uniref:IclR family transcriptional regulator domain-containing protein n=1 Tax=Bacillus piscicola TaxID=1632684 RepID=UPI001F09D47C